MLNYFIIKCLANDIFKTIIKIILTSRAIKISTIIIAAAIQ